MKNHQDPELQAFLDTATAGLQVDPELQLDVQAEIESHIQTSIENSQMEPESSFQSKREEALKEFGPPEEIADQLVDGNRGKMKTRARMRLVFNAFLIPLAILIAIAAAWPVYRGLVSNQPLYSLFDSTIPGIFMTGSSSIRDIFGGHQLTRQEQLIIQTENDQDDMPDPHKALWESEPENPVFYANYITHALTSIDYSSQESIDDMLDKLAYAKEIDPNNANYDYIRAGILFQNAASVESEEVGRDEKDNRIYEHHLEIKDREQLNASMQAFEQGLDKPFLRRYHKEMLQKKLEILGPPTSRLEQIEQISVAASTLLPELSMYRNIARGSVLYGADLLENPEADGAADSGPDPEVLLASWKPLTRQVIGDSFTLIDVLVGAAITNFGAEQSAEAFETVGRPEDAEAMKESGKAIASPVEEWRASIKSPESNKWEQEMLRQAGILDRVLLPAIGPPREEYGIDFDFLKAGRLLDFILVEQLTFTLLVEVLTVMMVVAFLLALRWRFSSGATAIPILLQPKLRQIAKILGLVVFLPMCVFLILRHFTPLGGMDVSIMISWPRTALHLCLLIGVITIGLSLNVRTYVERRFRVLGLVTPGSIPKTVQIAAGLTLAYLAIASVLPDSILQDEASGQVIAGIGIGLSAIWLIAGALVSLASGLAAKAEYGLFFGSLCRTFIPILSVAIIILGILARPYLDARERYIVSNDPATLEVNETGGFTAMENHIVKYLRGEMIEAFEKQSDTTS
jgi:hypothetical protein